MLLCAGGMWMVMRTPLQWFENVFEQSSGAGRHLSGERGHGPGTTKRPRPPGEADGG